MSTEAFHETLRALAETPARITTLLNDFSAGESRNRHSPDDFSALENICHLRDLEVEGYTVRIERLLKESHPFLADFAGGKLAIERRYNDQNLEEAFRKFAEARAANVRTLEAVPVEQLEREGTLENLGPITLGRLVLMMQEHDEGHLADLHLLRGAAERERQGDD